MRYILNFSAFFVQKIRHSGIGKERISRPIIKIAIAAVALSVAVMLIALASGRGLQKAIDQKTTGFSGDITVRNFDQNASFEPEAISRDSSLEEFLVNNPGILHFQTVTTKACIARSESGFEGLLFKGVGPDYSWDFLKERLVDGTLPKVAENEVLLSQLVAQRLQVVPGDRLILSFVRNPPAPPRNFPVVISGMYATGMEDFDKQIILGDIGLIRSVNQWTDEEIGGYEILLAPGVNRAEMADEINGNARYDLIARTIRENYPQIFEWLDLFDLNILIINVIMALVAGVNMTTVLLILIMERTATIGLLKSLGASHSVIRGIFIRLVLYLVGRGVLWGNAVAAALFAFQHFTGWITMDETTYYVREVPFDIHLVDFILVDVFTLLICALIMLGPSAYIGKIMPARALRID